MNKMKKCKSSDNGPNTAEYRYELEMTLNYET